MFHPDAGDYEFTEAQNATIRRVSLFMLIFSVLSLVLAGFLGGRGVHLLDVLWQMAEHPQRLYQNSQILSDVATSTLQTFVGGLAAVLFAVLVLRSAKSFRAISATQGSDIPNLMAALSSLDKVYAIGFVLSLAMLILLIVSLVAARQLLL